MAMLSHAVNEACFMSAYKSSFKYFTVSELTSSLQSFFQSGLTTMIHTLTLRIAMLIRRNFLIIRTSVKVKAFVLFQKSTCTFKGRESYIFTTDAYSIGNNKYSQSVFCIFQISDAA